MPRSKTNKPIMSKQAEKGARMGNSTQPDLKQMPNRSGQKNSPGPKGFDIDTALRQHYEDFRLYLLRRMDDPAAAEDVLQNFCIRVMQNRTVLRDPNRAMGWLYTVLRSVLMDHYRKEKSRRRGESGYAEDVAVLSKDVVGSEQDDIICGCVNGLAFELQTDHAEILRRIDFEDEPRDHVCHELGVTPQNLRVRLHRARSALKAAIQSHCGACCKTGFRDCYCNTEGASSA